MSHKGLAAHTEGSDKALAITVEDGVERSVFRLSGDLDALNVPRLRAILMEHASDDRDTVIDLAGLQFIDSSGLGVLVGALKRYQAAGRRLSLRSPTPSLQRVLEMTGLAQAFTIES